MPSILTHNGTLTVQSTRTGDHRTFRVKTQAKDASFAPGQRIVQLMIGPDNNSSYSSFAFLKIQNQQPKVHVWKKHRNTEIQNLAKMLEQLEAHESVGNVEIHFATTCRVCNRKLTTPESVESGIGPVCEMRDS